ncbi:MAG: DUF4332 domain-containing protein [Clostridia bacterium]|nr:DUF4332 domain-containing protein [Clostridia bacterium]
MGYYIDIEKITLDEYKDILKGAYMIPSRQMLKDDIDANIDIFIAMGIENVAQLQSLLKSKAKVQSISKDTGLDEKYLNAMRLELSAYTEKPTKISEFGCLNNDTAVKLETVGIKDTLLLYDRVITDEKRQELSSLSGVSIDEIEKAAKLADISRIRWVNHTFACVLYASGYDSVEKIAKSDHEKLYTDVKTLNAREELFKGNIGLNDMKLVVLLAQALPKDIIV